MTSGNPFSTTGLVVRGRTVASILPGTSAAEEQRIQPGDIIVSISGREVQTEGAINSALRGAVGTSVRLIFQRAHGHRFAVDLERRALVVPHDCAEDGNYRAHTLSSLWDNSSGREASVWGLRDESSIIERVPQGVLNELREAQSQLEALMSALGQRDSELASAKLQIQQLSSRVRELEHQKAPTPDNSLRMALEAERRENEALRSKLVAGQLSTENSDQVSGLMPLIEDSCAFLAGCRERVLACCEDLPKSFGSIQSQFSILETQTTSAGEASDFFQRRRSELGTLSEEIRNFTITAATLSPPPASTFSTLHSQQPRNQTRNGKLGPTFRVLERELSGLLKLSEEVATASRGLTLSRKLSAFQLEVFSFTSRPFAPGTQKTGLTSQTAPFRLHESLQRLQEHLHRIGEEHTNIRMTSQIFPEQDQLEARGTSRLGWDANSEAKEVMDRLVTQVENMLTEHSRKCPISLTDIRVGVSALRLAAQGASVNHQPDLAYASSSFLALRKSISSSEQQRAAATREVENLIANISAMESSPGSDSLIATLVSPMSAVDSGGVGGPANSHTGVSDLVRSLDKRSQILEEQLQQATRSRSQTEEQVSMLESELEKQATHFRNERAKFMARLKELENVHGDSAKEGAGRSSRRDSTESSVPDDGDSKSRIANGSTLRGSELHRGKGHSLTSPRTLRYLDELGSDDTFNVKKLEIEVQAMSGELEKEKSVRRNLEAETVKAAERRGVESRTLESLDHIVLILNEKLSAERRKVAFLDDGLRKEKSDHSILKAQYLATQSESRSQKARWEEESLVTEERIKKLETWLAEEQEKASAGLVKSKKLEAELLAEREFSLAIKNRNGPRADDLEEKLFETRESANFSEAHSAARESRLALERDQARVLLADADARAQAQIRRAETTSANLKEKCDFLHRQLAAARGWHADDSSLGRISNDGSESDARFSANETQFAASRAHSLETQLRGAERHIAELELEISGLNSKIEESLAQRRDLRKTEEERDELKQEKLGLETALNQVLDKVKGAIDLDVSDIPASSHTIASPPQAKSLGNAIVERINALLTVQGELQTSNNLLENKIKKLQSAADFNERFLEENSAKSQQILSEQSSLKNKLQKSESACSALQAELENTERELVELKASFREKGKEVTLAIASVAEKQSELDEAKSTLQEMGQRFNGSRNELANFEEKSNALLEQLTQKEMLLKTVEGKLVVVEEQCTEAVRDRNEKVEILKANQEKLAEYEAALVEAQWENSKLSTSNSQLEEEIAGLRQKVKSLTLLQSEASEASEALEAVRRELGAKAALVVRIESELEEKRVKFDKSQEELAHHEDRLKGMQRTLNEKDEALRRLEREQSADSEMQGENLQVANAKVISLERELESYTIQCQELETKLKKSREEASRSGNLKAEIKKLQDELDTVISRSNTLAEEYVSENERATRAQEEASRLSADFDAKVEEIRKLRGVISEREDRIAQQQDEIARLLSARGTENDEVETMKETLREREMELCDTKLRLEEAEERLALLADEFVAMSATS